jgi:hypothetical protein
MGYSGKEQRIQMFVQHPDGQCVKDLGAYHYAGKYFAIYMGRDGHYYPFNGKFAYTTLRFGPGAYLPEPTKAPELL